MRLPNTFQAQTPIGQAIASLGTAIFSGPSPQEQALTDAQVLLAEQRARGAGFDANRQAIENRALTGIGDVFAGLVDPSTGGVNPDTLPELFGRGVQGGFDGNIGDLILAFTANMPGTTDPTVGRSFVGAGNAIGPNDGFSLPDRENVARRNADLDLRNDLTVQAAKGGGAGGAGEGGGFSGDVFSKVSLEDAIASTRPLAAAALGVDGELLDDQVVGLILERATQLSDQTGQTLQVTVPEAARELQRSGEIGRSQDTGTVLGIPIPGFQSNDITVQPGQVPPQAVEMLKRDPSPEARREFDEVFGPGAAARVLGET